MNTVNSSETAVTWGSLLFGLNSLRLLALCGGVALYAVNINVINTLLPTIIRDLGGVAYYSWATSLFMAASVLSVALSASLIDYLGLRAAFLFALFVFVVGALGTAFSPDIYYLLVARSVQGLGGGLLLGLSFAAIRFVFLESLWLRATAIISSMWGLCALAGPAVGGHFAQSGQWRLAFVAIVPIAIVVGLLVLLSLKAREENEDRALIKIPIFKALLLVWSVVALSFAGLTASWLLIALAVVIGVTILYVIARDDFHSHTPLFPIRAYSLKRPLGALYLGVALMSAAISSEIFVPYFLESIYQLSPMWAGYMMALVPAGWAVGALSAVRQEKAPTLSKRLVAGPLLSTISLVSLGLLIWSLPASLHIGVVMLILAVALFGIGLGIGIIWPHLVTQVFLSASPGQENRASAGIITLQLYAMAVGMAFAGIIISAVSSEKNTFLQNAQQGALALFVSYAVLPLLFIGLSKAARHAVSEPS